MQDAGVWTGRESVGKNIYVVSMILIMKHDRKWYSYTYILPE